MHALLRERFGAWATGGLSTTGLLGRWRLLAIVPSPSWNIRANSWPD